MKKNKRMKKKKFVRDNRKDMEMINFWGTRIDRDDYNVYFGLTVDEVKPFVGIVTYLNKQEKFGYIFGENGDSIRFNYHEVYEKDKLAWNKPVLFAHVEGILNVLAVSGIDILRQRGASNNTYRSFGNTSKGKVKLRS